jgi:multidrug efflux system outer membrane protein
VHIGLEDEVDVAGGECGVDEAHLGIVLGADLAGEAVAGAAADALAAGVEVSTLQQERMELENVIALLTGRNASEFRLPVTGKLPRVPTLPRVLPSELLKRRPDIAEASHRIEAALGLVNAARTAWLPSLHLQAGVGSSSERFSKMDEDAAQAGMIGFTFSLPLFDGGRRRAALNAAKATHQEGVEQQRQIILAAVADAESALGKVYWGREQHAQASASAEAAGKSASLISSKFAAGGVDTFQQLLAERLRLDAARLKVRTQTAQLRSVVALIRALGGGWNL